MYFETLPQRSKTFPPLEPARPSHQEGLALLDEEFLVAKVFASGADSGRRKSWLKPMLHRAIALGSRTSVKVSSHFPEVQSEKGFCEKTTGMPKADIAEPEKYQPLKHGSGKRLCLALANCYLD